MKNLISRLMASIKGAFSSTSEDTQGSLLYLNYKRGLLVTIIIAALCYIVMQLFMAVPYVAQMFANKYHLLNGTWLGNLMASHKLMTSSIMSNLSYIIGLSATVGFLLLLTRKAGFSLKKLNQTAIHSAQDVKSNLLRAMAYLAVGDVLVALAYKFISLPSPNSPAGDFGQTLISVPAFMGFAFSTVVLAPIFEELVFRGFFFNMYKGSFVNSKVMKYLRLDKAATPMAILLSGATFGAFHSTLTGFPPLFILGCVLAFTYNQTKHLTCGRMIHMLNNLVATMALYFAVFH